MPRPRKNDSEETWQPELFSLLLTINELTLANYRRFSNLSLSFHPQVTVLAARNGLGKTAVLDAIAVALGPFVGAFDEGQSRHFEQGDVRQARGVGSPLEETEPQYPILLAAEGFVAGRSAAWRRQLTGPRSHTTFADAKVLEIFGKSLQRQVREAATGKGSPSPTLPLVAYYGTGRLWGEMRLTSGKRAAVRTSRTAGYTDCLTSSSRYRAFVDWFERLSRAEYEERDNPEKLKGIRAHLWAIRHAVDRVLAPTGWGHIAYKSSAAGIVATHAEQGTLPVAWLSDGIRNMIALTADIAHRAVRLNAHLGAVAVEGTPGIVLIDEIEMHLHPEWQQVIVEALCGAFPSVQFIMTTHSPQVISSVRKESLRILKELEGEMYVFLQPDFQTRGVDSSEVLARIMGVDPVPLVEEAQMLSEYRALIEAGETEGERALLLRTHLSEHFGADHPVMLECDRLIRFQKFRIRQNPAAKG